MEPTPLEPSKISELIKLQHNRDRHAETIQDKIGKWPGDINMLRLANAVESEAPEVVFTSGDKFSIRYESNFNSVFIKPTVTDMVIPCGYFDKDHLKSVLEAD